MGAGDNKTPGTGEHECQRCGSDEWTWCDYRGCSDCFEPDRGDNKMLPERLRECARVQNVGVPYGQPVVVTLLREAAVALETAEAKAASSEALWRHASEDRAASEREIQGKIAALGALYKERDDLQARVEAVEAENAELKAGDDRSAVAVAQASQPIESLPAPELVEGIPENKDAPCNICGRGWPYHWPACAYAGNDRDRRTAEARVVALEEALRRLREDMEPRLELGQWRYMPHGTARDRVEAILDALASSVKQEKEGLGGDIRRPSGGAS